MAVPDHNILPVEEYNQDFNQWEYVEADPSRPPVYNADNRSCPDIGGFTNALAPIPQPAASPPRGFQYENRRNAYYQPPQSYASSTASVPCPEGVEREDPGLAVANNYLPLGPDTGLNEIAHRRSASIHSDMSYQLRRYLADQQKAQSPRNVSPSSHDKFLPQDIYIQSSRKVKNRKRSKPSHKSSTSSSSEDQGFVGWGAPPTAYTGRWIEDDRLGYCEDGFGYSSSLSGMTDELMLNDFDDWDDWEFGV